MNRKKISSILLLGIGILNLLPCGAQTPGKIPKGKIIDEKTLFEYAIYYLNNDKNSKESIAKIIKNKYPDFTVVDDLPEPEDVSGAMVVVKEISNVQEDYVPPDMEYLSHSDGGLSQEQKELLQKSNFVIQLVFVCDRLSRLHVLKMANNLMLDLTTKNTIIWDEETRECFSPEFWKENRIIVNENVNIGKHITIHFYKNTDYCRAISLGMVKFGLPDICVEDISCNSIWSFGSLINLTAQTLFEKEAIAEEGKLVVSIDDIQNLKLKNDLLSTLKDNAEKKAEISIIEGKRDEGDPDNRIIEIAFSKERLHIEHDELIEKIFGATDDTTNVTHTTEILEASNHAKERIPELRKMVTDGMEAGTHLLIKFPFENETGDREWMWVEVVKWNKDEIEGLLQNNPTIIKDLKAGQVVKRI